MATLFDFFYPQVSAATSLREIKESNQATAQNERIRVLTELLRVATDPVIRTQVESILHQEFNNLDEDKLYADKLYAERKAQDDQFFAKILMFVLVFGGFTAFVVGLFYLFGGQHV
jgi:hypothetical protein